MLVVSNYNDLKSQLGSESTQVVFEKDVLIEKTDDEKHVYHKVANTKFKKSLTISSGIVDSLVFENCYFHEIKLSGKIDMKLMHFKECEIHSLDYINDGNIEILAFTQGCCLGQLYIGGNGTLGMTHFKRCKELNALSFNSISKKLVLNDKDVTVKGGEDSKGDYTTTRIDIDIQKTNNISIFNKTIKYLMLFNSSEDAVVELHNMDVGLLTILDSIQVKWNVINMTQKTIPRKHGLTIVNSDINNGTFVNCQFKERAHFSNTNLEECQSIGTSWPTRLIGKEDEKQFGFRQLKQLHQKHGYYREQFFYHKQEMTSFKNIEKKLIYNSLRQVKGIKSLFRWFTEFIEYLVRVGMPFSTSRFGLQVFRPLFLYILFALLSGLMLFQFQLDELSKENQEILDLDVNLFLHILLPTHKSTFRGVQLVEWVDVSWRLVSSYLLYHIVISSRKLTKT